MVCGTMRNKEKLSLGMKSVTFETLSHFQTTRSGFCREEKAKTNNKKLGLTETAPQKLTNLH